MDTKEYIESGILESYAMGLVSEQEVKEVECLTAIYPELKSQLNQIQETIEKYVHTLATPAPSESLDIILKRVQNTDQEVVLSKLKVIKENGVQKAKESPVNKSTSYFKYATAASILVVVGLGFVINSLVSKQAAFEEEVIAMKEQTNQQLVVMKDSLKNSIAERSFLLEPATEAITLAGTDLSPNSVVKVFFNREKKEYAIEYNKLPKPLTGKQYQLWAIVDGNPVDLGVLNKSKSAEDKRKIDFESIQAFAITLEQEGGSEKPTMEAMYVVGAV